MIPSVMSLLALVSLSLVLSVGSGPASKGQLSTSTPVGQPSVRVFAPLAKACDPDEVVAFLNGFLDAFNRGDVTALSEMYPTNGVYPYSDKHGFQWYSVTDESGHFVTFDPSELPSYFASRLRQHEQLRIVELAVGSAGFESGYLRPAVSLQVHLLREADDLPPALMVGKGGAYCDPYQIFVWSMAGE